MGPDGLSRFDELRRREAARTAILYAFDLIEHDGEDLRDRPFLDRKAALARLLRDTEVGIRLNEHVVGDGPTVFEHACRLGAEGIVSKRADGTYRSGPCSVWVKVRNTASGSAARNGIGDPRAKPRVAAGRQRTIGAGDGRGTSDVLTSSASASPLYCTAIRR
jgi:bifunctional non-homologous end joining protein LigD